MMSRTKLKQQLMKDQMQQIERREALSKAYQLLEPITAINNSILPPSSFATGGAVQNYQIQTRLENPTKYHVLQCQKLQITQYLNEGINGSQNGIVHSPLVDPMSPAGFTNPNSPLSGPASTSAATSPSEFEDILEEISHFEPSSTNEATDQFLYKAPYILPNDSNEGSYTIPNESNFLDYLTTDPSYSNQTSSSCPPELPQIKQEAINFKDTDIRAIVKDRQKKDNHNMIERRRRFNINDRIKELGALLPKNNESFFELARDSRQSKGTILKASVDYVRVLKSEANKIPKMEQKVRSLESYTENLESRVRHLEGILHFHGIPNEIQQPVQNQSQPFTEIVNAQSQPFTEIVNAQSQPFTEIVNAYGTQWNDLNSCQTIFNATKSPENCSSPLDEIMEEDPTPIVGDPFLPDFYSGNLQ